MQHVAACSLPGLTCVITKTFTCWPSHMCHLAWMLAYLLRNPVPPCLKLADAAQPCWAAIDQISLACRVTSGVRSAARCGGKGRVQPFPFIRMFC